MSVGTWSLYMSYLGGRFCVWELWALLLPLGGTVSIPNEGGNCSCGSAPCPSPFQHVCGFIALLFEQSEPPSGWFSVTFAKCVSIIAFAIPSSGNTTPHFFSAQTSAQGIINRYCISSIVVHENPVYVILALFKTRLMSNCGSCTQPPGHAIVAAMFKIYKQLVAASKDDIGHFPLPYTTP